jgi:hypothetical protein
MDSPEQWVGRYLALRAPAFRTDGRASIPTLGPEIAVPITQYANASEANYQRPRTQIMREMESWARGPAHRLGLNRTGDNLQLLVTPPVHTTLGAIARVFGGKGSPGEIRDVLVIASLWMTTSPQILATAGVTDLPGFAQRYIGVDCNGFVGTYLRANYPQTHFGPEFYIPAVSAHSRACATLSDVDSLCLIISQGLGHVSIIGAIFSRTDSQIDCNQCQSRSPALGGPHLGRITIRRNHTQFTVNHSPVTGIYRLRNLAAN